MPVAVTGADADHGRSRAQRAEHLGAQRDRTAVMSDLEHVGGSQLASAGNGVEHARLRITSE